MERSVVTDPAPPLARSGRVAWSVALTSVAQASAMALGGVLAVLIAARFGGSAETDGFFAAYGAYGLVVLIAQSTRLTLVPRLVAGRWATFDRYLAAAGVIWLATGVVFVAGGAPLAAVLSGDPTARDAAREALLLLWPAAGAQLFASLAAAMLGVLADYTWAAAAYAGGGVISIAGFLALAPSAGVTAVPLGLLGGALFTAAVTAAAVVAKGWRPGRSALGALGGAGTIVVGAASVAIPQLLYLVSIAVAGRLGTGEQTVYSYAFFGAGLLVAVVSSSISIVLAAPLAETWDRDVASLRSHVEDTFDTGLLALAPVIALAAVLGDEVGELLLAKFSPSQVDDTIAALLLLAPLVVAAMMTAVPLIALYALRRHAAIALLAPPLLALHVVLSLLARELDGTAALAGAASVSSLVLALAVLWLLHGRGAPAVVARLTAHTVALGLPAAACFALPALVAPDAVAAAVGLLLYGALIAVLPRPRGLLRRLAGQNRR